MYYLSLVDLLKFISGLVILCGNNPCYASYYVWWQGSLSLQSSNVFLFSVLLSHYCAFELSYIQCVLVQCSYSLFQFLISYFRATLCRMKSGSILTGVGDKVHVESYIVLIFSHQNKKYHNVFFLFVSQSLENSTCRGSCHSGAQPRGQWPVRFVSQF